MRADDYYPAQRAAIHTLLALPGTRLFVACLADDDDTIAGWACYSEPGTLHYVAVQRELRGNGIARQLLHGLPIVRYTHKPRTMGRPPAGWSYQPFAFWSPAPAQREKAAA